MEGGRERGREGGARAKAGNQLVDYNGSEMCSPLT